MARSAHRLQPYAGRVRGDPNVPEWEYLSSEPGYAGWLHVRRDQYRLPNGVVHEWDVLEQGRAIAVVPFTDRGTVVLFDQFRVGARRVLAEVPGGLVDAGEDVVHAGMRELLEETGYRPAAVFHVDGEWTAASSERRKHALVATGCEPVQAPEWEDTEHGLVHEVPVPEFIEHVLSGDLSDGGTVARALLVFVRSDDVPERMRATQHELRAVLLGR
jgi:8-oxo-dGTP pyrophosphatase MutT (NUDIX family)